MTLAVNPVSVPFPFVRRTTTRRLDTREYRARKDALVRGLTAWCESTPALTRQDIARTLPAR